MITATLEWFPSDVIELAEANTILRGVVGSTAHGLGIDEEDDRDEMGVFVEPPEYLLGLKRVGRNARLDTGEIATKYERLEHVVARTQPQGVRSGPGDLDVTIYTLRKYAKLALNGNPTVLLLLFLQERDLVSAGLLGRELRAHAEWFVSKAAGRSFLGYMTNQRQRLTGERGQMRVNRPELIRAYGYDTKYAGHVIRLGFQGLELLQSGWITLPMPSDEREHILSIRRGEIEFKEILRLATELERDIEQFLPLSSLPEEPAYEKVDAWLCESYLEHWSDRVPDIFPEPPWT